jgi:hydrogenase expression/formation protein HypC
MCLAIPGKILSIEGHDPFLRTGRVSFGGIVKEINLAFVPEATIGEYVIVHAGIAINQLDTTIANHFFEHLDQLFEIDPLQEPPTELP